MKRRLCALLALCSLASAGVSMPSALFRSLLGCSVQFLPLHSPLGQWLYTVVGSPLSVAGSLGWEAVFYIHGGLATMWCILWVPLVTDSPFEHKFMSKAEKDFIRNSLDVGKDNSRSKVNAKY